MERAEAKALGLKRYSTGKPCKSGHVAARWAANKSCVECAKGDCARYRAANPEKVVQYSATYRAADPEKLKQLKAKYREDNREKVRQGKAKYARANRGPCTARGAKYRAAKLQATTAWSHPALLLAIYEQAHELGFSVDHVIPLNHPLVCGLHVPFNLQLLTKADNSRKHNTFHVC